MKSFYGLLLILFLSGCGPINLLVLTTKNDQVPTSESVLSVPTNVPPTLEEIYETNQLGNPSSSITTNRVPNFDHIAIIILENQDYQTILGNEKSPYLNELASQNVSLTNFFAVTHPSLPNYIGLISGDTQGIKKDCLDCYINQPNLADLIDNSGRTWKTYQEDMPSSCFVGNAKPYYQKHNPFMYFDSVRLNDSRCNQSVVPLTELDQDIATNLLPNFLFIVPNICNSSHDCPINTADKWTEGIVNKLLKSYSMRNNGLIIVTFDEASKKNKGSCCELGNEAGGQIFTVLISSDAKPGFVDNTEYSQYNLLKTILAAWNLPDMGKTSFVDPILEPWK